VQILTIVTIYKYAAGIGKEAQSTVGWSDEIGKGDFRSESGGARARIGKIGSSCD
jgi:hypothetical protein